MTVRVRDVGREDADAWAGLYRGYRAFYRLPEDPAAVGTTWRWVSERQHDMFGIVATADDGALAGLANLRWFARPSTATIGLYLDDLFTDPGRRGEGVGTALLQRIGEIAAEREASVVRWITASGNATARRVYDTVATATDWVTYDMAPRAPHAGVRRDTSSSSDTTKR